jgi:biopolymer transport protein ExbD
MPVKIKKGIAGGMDMTPMIDVVFQLMIFFLVATRLDESERQLQVTLPQASEAKPITARPFEFFININREGQYFVDGQFRSLSELERLLAQTAANNPQQTVRIRADEDAAHKYVVGAMNACIKSGLTDYRIDTVDPAER